MKKSMICLLSALSFTTTLCAYAPKDSEYFQQIHDPYNNPDFSQGLSPKDITTQYNDGNIVRDISDSSISKQIKDILASKEFSQGYQDITFTVIDGIVTLRGHVSRPDDKLTLEDRVRKILGVILVSNQISITGSDNKVIQAPIIQ